MNETRRPESLAHEREKARRLERQVQQLSRELDRERERLRSAQEYFDKVIATMTSIFLVIDTNLTIETFNPAAIEVLGYSTDELHGMSLTRVMTMREISRFMAARQEHGSADYRAETNMTNKNGKIIPVLITASIMPGATPEDERIVCLAVDLSEQKALQGQVVQSQKLESVGQLAAGIAHELNTPIQYIRDNMSFLETEFEGIKSFVKQAVGALKEVTPQDTLYPRAQSLTTLVQDQDIPFLLDEIPNAIQQTKDGAESVARIVRAMKEFSHPGTSERVDVDVNRLLESVATISRNEWKYIAALRLELDPELPPIGCFVGELNQAILNILVNASHAVADANKALTRDIGEIALSTSFSESEVVIRISDNGLGIPARIRERIFEPFFTTKEVGRGTGQGLSIAYATIVRKHGGKLTFDSQVGKGTTFEIKLPRVAETMAPA